MKRPIRLKQMNRCIRRRSAASATSVRAIAQTCGICNLPLELIDYITSTLSDEDLARLRLVCRDLHRLTYPAFARTRFAVLRTGLAEADLKNLQRIAANEQLRTAVRKLQFYPGYTRRIRKDSSRKDPSISRFRIPLSWFVYFQRSRGDAATKRLSRTLSGALDLTANPTSYWLEALKLINCTQVELNLAKRGDYIPNTDALCLLLSLIRCGLTVRTFTIRTHPHAFFPHGYFHDSKIHLEEILESREFQTCWASCIHHLQLNFYWDEDMPPVIRLINMAQNLKVLHLEGRLTSSQVTTLANTRQLPQVIELMLGVVTDAAHASLLEHFVVRVGSRLESLVFYASIECCEADVWRQIIQGFTQLPRLRRVIFHRQRRVTSTRGPTMCFCPLLDHPEAQEDEGFDVSMDSGSVKGVRYQGDGARMGRALRLISDSIHVLSEHGGMTPLLEPQSQSREVWANRSFSDPTVEEAKIRLDIYNCSS